MSEAEAQPTTNRRARLCHLARSAAPGDAQFDPFHPAGCTEIALAVECPQWVAIEFWMRRRASFGRKRTICFWARERKSGRSAWSLTNVRFRPIADIRRMCDRQTHVPARPSPDAPGPVGRRWRFPSDHLLDHWAFRMVPRRKRATGAWHRSICPYAKSLPPRLREAGPRASDGEGTAGRRAACQGSTSLPPCAGGRLERLPRWAAAHANHRYE